MAIMVATLAADHFYIGTLQYSKSQTLHYKILLPMKNYYSNSELVRYMLVFIKIQSM